MTAHYKHFISWQNIFSDNSFPEDISQLTEAQVSEIKNNLASLLSPENLHCDGEATLQDVKKKREHYQMICREISANTNFDLNLKEITKLC